MEDDKWITAEQAAELFDVSIREIKERYQPRLNSNEIKRPSSEYEYKYDFEEEDCDWSEYIVRELKTTNPFKRKFNHVVERGTQEDHSDSVIMSTEEAYGYDFGLEPKSRKRGGNAQVQYSLKGLWRVREEKLLSRVNKPLPPRGADGRFKPVEKKPPQPELEMQPERETDLADELQIELPELKTRRAIENYIRETLDWEQEFWEIMKKYR